MSNFFEKVSEFNQAVIGYEAPVAPSLLPTNVLELTLIQLREEVGELEDAAKEGDVVACVDALLDLIYFANGALYKMGITPEQYDGCVTAIQTYNMRKKAGKKEGRGYEGDAVDAIKPGADVPRPEVVMKQILGEV